MHHFRAHSKSQATRSLSPEGFLVKHNILKWREDIQKTSGAKKEETYIIYEDGRSLDSLRRDVSTRDDTCPKRSK